MKNGYKKTSLGILPNEWEVVQLEEICEINQGLQIAISKRYTENAENRYFYITNEFLKETCKTKYYIENPPKSVICCKDDILMTRTGNTGQVVTNINGVFHNNFFKIKYNKKTIDKKYFLYILSANKMQHKILTKAGGSTILDLKHSDFYSLKIPLPPLNEQRKIAEILSSYDEAILLTSNLISAKKEFKKALMQNLLTAKIRFPNFNGIWKEVKLGKFIKEQTIRNTKNINLVLSVTNKFGFVEQSNYFEKEVASKDTSNYKVIKNGNFAYNPSRINVGSIALLENFEVGILSPMYVIFDCLDGINKKFLKYWLQSHNFTGNLYKYLAGSVRETLNFKDMKNFKIKLPNLAEQTKIAEILSSVDDEIDLLNQKLEQLNLQKRGIMQNLLSGKIRVKL